MSGASVVSCTRWRMVSMWGSSTPIWEYRSCCCNRERVRISRREISRLDMFRTRIRFFVCVDEVLLRTSTTHFAFRQDMLYHNEMFCIVTECSISRRVCFCWSEVIFRISTKYFVFREYQAILCILTKCFVFRRDPLYLDQMFRISI